MTRPFTFPRKRRERLACDAGVVRMQHDADGHVLDVGRKTRTIPSAIRRALSARDTRCQFPGCSARRCDAHHIEHWVDGGPTRLDNLVLLCRRHHRLVHEGGFTVERQPDRTVAFFHADGTQFVVAPHSLDSTSRTPSRRRPIAWRRPASPSRHGRSRPGTARRSMPAMPSTCYMCHRGGRR